MKNTILWIAAILMVAGCSQKKAAEVTVLGFGTQYTQFPEKLKGKVKEMHEVNYWAVEQNGEIIKGAPMTWKELDSVQSLKNVIEYWDEAGNHVKEANIDENNVVKNYIVATYENGKPVRWDRYRADTIYNYYKPIYSAEGVHIGGQNLRVRVDTVLSTVELSYDDKGNYTRYALYNFKNAKAGAQEYSVTPDGKITEVRFYNAKDSLTDGWKQAYDENGFMVSQIASAGKNAPWKFTPLKYDDKGNWTLELQDEDNGKFRFVTERTYVYY